MKITSFLHNLRCDWLHWWRYGRKNNYPNFIIWYLKVNHYEYNFSFNNLRWFIKKRIFHD